MAKLDADHANDSDYSSEYAASLLDAFDAPLPPPLSSDAMSVEEHELLLLMLNDEHESEHAQQLAAAAANAGATTTPQLDSNSEHTQHSDDATSTASQFEADSTPSPSPSAPSTVPALSPAPQTVVKVNPRRNRKRRKHEVDALRIEMRTLSDKLAELQRESASAARHSLTAVGTDSRNSSSNGRNALIAVHVEVPGNSNSNDPNTQSQPAHWIVIKNDKRQVTAPKLGKWEHQARIERDAAVTTMRENKRLRTLYESKLETLRYLEALYTAQQQPQPASFWTGDPLSVQWRQDQTTAAAQLTKCARLNPFDPDFAIFASLGRDFDAQYAKTDAILGASGVTNLDCDFKRKMQPTRGANGIFFLETVRSRVHLRDMFEHDERHWSILSRHDLHMHHGLFEIREMTQHSMLRKMVHTLRLPNGIEATLTRRTALKRFVEPHRVVTVWDTALEISGPLSMQLRERGWKVMRAPRVLPPGYTGGPIHVYQSCTRITPELCSTYAAEDIADGSVTNAVVASYHRHMRWLAHLNRELAFAEFSKLSVGDCRSRPCCHRHPNCHKQKECERDCSDELPSIFEQTEPLASSSSASSGPQLACVV